MSKKKSAPYNKKVVHWVSTKDGRGFENAEPVTFNPIPPGLLTELAVQGNPFFFPCPFCHVGRFGKCVSSSGKQARVHKDRLKAAIVIFPVNKVLGNGDTIECAVGDLVVTLL